MDVLRAAADLLLLDTLLVVTFILVAAAMYASYRLTDRMFCQVCVAVSFVSVLNLVFRVLPNWMTIFLMGQSTAGSAGLVRDAAPRRWSRTHRSARRRPVAKQLVYFLALTGGTLAGAAGLSALLGLPMNLGAWSR